MHPRAIVEGFVVEASATGLVLRHAEREAVQLTGVAAAVWRHADGLRSVDELAEVVGAEVDAVWLALDELADAELVVSRVAPPVASRGLSRREVLSLAAGGAVTAGLAPGFAAAAEAKPVEESAAQREQGQKVGKEQEKKVQAQQAPSAQEARAKVEVRQEQDVKASAQRQEQDSKVRVQKQEQANKKELVQEQDVKGSAQREQRSKSPSVGADEQDAKGNLQRQQEERGKAGGQEQAEKVVKVPTGE